MYKINVDNNLIKEIVQKEYKGLNLREIYQYHDGFVHKKYRISFDKGDSVVLRFPAEIKDFIFGDSYSLGKEAYITRLIREKTDIKVPRILSLDKHKDIEYLLMDCLEGDNLTNAPRYHNKETIENIIQEWGAAMSQIHSQIKFSDIGYIGENGLVKTFDKFSDIFERFLKLKLISDDIPIELRKESEEFFLKYKDQLDKEKDPTLVLYDINTGNVIVNNKGRLGGLLDFDCAFSSGNTSPDFMFSLLDRKVGDVNIKDLFLKGYKEGGGKLPQNLDILNKLNTLNFILSTILFYKGATGHRATWSTEYTQKLEQFLKENG